MTELNTSQISKLKVAELKEHLESRGLATDGKKDELVSRLTQAIEAEKAKGKETETTEEHQTPAEPEQQAVTSTLEQAEPAVTLDESTEETAGAAAVESESTGPKKFAPIQWTGPEAAAKPPSASENPTVAAEDPSGTNHGEKLWAEMTEVEKILARAKKYGTPVDEKQLAAAKLQERAKRFNLEPAQAAAKAAADSTQNKTPAASKSAPAKAAKEIDVTVLKKRQERFGAVNPEIAKVVTNAEEEEKRKRRLEKFGPQEPVKSFHKKRKF